MTNICWEKKSRVFQHRNRVLECTLHSTHIDRRLYRLRECSVQCFHVKVILKHKLVHILFTIIALTRCRSKSYTLQCCIFRTNSHNNSQFFFFEKKTCISFCACVSDRTKNLKYVFFCWFCFSCFIGLMLFCFVLFHFFFFQF